jgi:hypothetical protein
MIAWAQHSKEWCPALLTSILSLLAAIFSFVVSMLNFWQIEKQDCDDHNLTQFHNN